MPMKRLLFSMAVIAMTLCASAQVATDSLASKIIIIPHIAITSDIPEQAQNLMMDRMKRNKIKNGRRKDTKN